MSDPFIPSGQVLPVTWDDECPCIDCRTRRGDIPIATPATLAYEDRLHKVGRDVPVEDCFDCPNETTGGQDFSDNVAAARGAVAREEFERLEEAALKEFRVKEWKMQKAVRAAEVVNGQPAMLPTDAHARKDIPLATGLIDYFPLALAAVAAVSRQGQKQHGTTGWDRAKSTDEADTLMRHFLERGTIDTDGHRHSAKVAWRALALLQKELEAAREG